MPSVTAITLDESEWLRSADLVSLYRFIFRSASPRRLRLFACAACRAVLQPVLPEPAVVALDAAERWADGQANRATLTAARSAAGWYNRNRHLFVEAKPLEHADSAADCATRPVKTMADKGAWYSLYAARALGLITRRVDGKNGWYDEHQASLLRDIFGNPFRPVTFSPAWRTDTAVSLARTMYDARDFSAMPILADALQDAGCDSDDILAHCRDTSLTHVRGCWVTDLVLGKS